MHLSPRMIANLPAEQSPFSPNETAFIDRFTAILITRRSGHENEDLYTYTLKVDNKKIAQLTDIDFGGGFDTEIIEDKKHQQVLKELNDQGYTARFNTLFWGDETVLHRTNEEMVGVLADLALHKALKLRSERQINNLSKRAIVYGTLQRNQQVTFKGVRNLEDMKNFEQGTQLLQQTLDEARIEMLPGDVIFNTPEQLAALGLK
jgi:hypothetical protein